MAGVPYIEQDPDQMSKLMQSLEQYRKGQHRGKASVKRTPFQVKESPNNITVDSWRFQEWDYKRRDLPVYARGLFTTKTRKNRHEIAVRGYDKFFNVDEVNETKWENILTKTKGPYELTLKENGCIIFIAGLEDETLIVCSKHSTGDRGGELTHSKAGEAWIEKQLLGLGKTKNDLAKELRQRNVTAVAELCDDAFEEHILAYGPDKAGLYLHGINLNVPEFNTYPSNAVQQFADAWGFRKTNYLVFEDVNKVKEFLEDAAITGAYDGRDVEGFVIRCKMSGNPANLPYEDWFFKFKFEEPYLMYRQWRECTKALILGKPPRFKKHVAITEEYLLYAKKRMAANPGLAKLYNQNHGIIALRNEFLDYKNIRGSDAANMDQSDVVVLPEVTQNVVLVPIATIGCGKTTVALALTELFGWGHIQNDNISGKGRPPRFTKAVLEQLEDKPVVFADRNNAQKHERKQIIFDTKTQHESVKMVCLNFRHDQESLEEIRKVTRERVIQRGDNHQTIHAASDQEKFLGVMDGFIGRFEPCSPLSRPDDGFDAFIDLDPVAGSRRNLETVVTKLHEIFPNVVKEVPTADQLDEAIESALGFKPGFRHEIPDRSSKQPARQPPKKEKNKPKELEYMSIVVPRHVVNCMLDKVFASCDKELSRNYMQLKQTRRIQSDFHVTLLHRASAKQFPELWQRYLALHDSAGGGTGKLGECDVVMERVVFDQRIMAIVVRIDDTSNIWECANRVAHITVGTRDNTVKPKESNVLLGNWLDEGPTGDIREVIFADKVTVPCSVHSVLSR
ncbi:tRNA ligase [Cordyceps fumosorosea ARSEF 2679]|uniref:tRNA ligase n=1 Tax=Cordyceps fumosorosea (strain ARSEF 2679) TaxID=1081104 RepID=A0A162M9R3_CORFA|nr:tRNA ligase [Cordyceps fumosorosea ARSEF 2679]OAA53040.1 tRNA ligase [Cordyceps fumosorosea ARSEF 2679]